MSVHIPDVKLPPDDKMDLVLCIRHDGTVFNPWGMELGKAIELPPHGRLIEADKLMANIRAHDYLLTAMCNSRENGMFTCGIQQAVDEADTIIPADQAKEDDLK